MHADGCQHYETTEFDGQKGGDWYTAANGHPVRNEGDTITWVPSMDGKRRRAMARHMAKATKAMGFVSQTIRRGQRVVFEIAGCYIERLRGGEVMRLEENDGGALLQSIGVPPKESNACQIDNKHGVRLQGP